MNEATAVHEVEGFCGLADNNLAFRLRQKRGNTGSQIAKLEILHDDVQIHVVLVPSVKLHEV